jgi:hypothetical protein
MEAIADPSSQPGGVDDPHERPPRQQPDEHPRRHTPHDYRFPNWSIPTMIDVVPSSTIAKPITPKRYPLSFSSAGR